MKWKKQTFFFSNLYDITKSYILVQFLFYLNDHYKILIKKREKDNNKYTILLDAP